MLNNVCIQTSTRAHAVKISYLATLYTFTKKKKMFGNNNVRFKELVCEL